MVRWFFILIFLTCFNHLRAQQMIFRNYSMQDGLVANPVRSIFQDANGFIWIATWQGLSKYDGYQFTNFNTTNGLSFDLVNDVCEPEPGKLLVALNNGDIDMITFDRVTRQVVKEKMVVNRFFKTSNGDICATTDGEGIGRLRGNRVDRLTRKFYGSVRGTVNDSMWIVVGDDGISFYIIDHHSNIVSRFREPPGEIHKIYQDSRHRTWACTAKGLLLLAPPRRQDTIVQLLPLPAHFNIPALSAIVTNMLEDGDGNYWIGTIEGLVRIHPNGRSQVFTRADGLPSSVIKCLYTDREKNLWIGTEQGISKIVQHNNIQRFTTANGLRDNILTSLYPAGSGLYFTTLHGIVQRWNGTNYTLATVTDQERQPFFNTFVKHQGQLFLSTGRELIMLDTIKHTTGRTRISPEKDFYSVASDSKGNLFFGTETGVYVKAIADGTIRPLGSIPGRITSLVTDQQGHLWAGTWDKGLYRIRLSYTGEVMTGVAESMRGLSPDSCIRYLFADSKGNIWAGTRYNGAVCIRNEGAGRFSSLHFSRQEGLTANFVFRITEDRKGNIWLASYLGGLDKLLPTGNNYRVFNFSRVNNFNEIVYGIHPVPGNLFWCVTSSGLVQFRDDEAEQLPPPKVFITRLQAGRGEGMVTVTDMQKPLRLDHHRNLMQFGFAAPSFINEKEILYRHRLAGNGDTTWSNPTTQHTVFYDGLLPGQYTFEVKALGWNGLWGAPAAYTFTIYPPWWQTWWFRAAVLLAVILIITVLFRNKVRSVRRETQIKQRIIETEMMALRAQMNPHFIFNCINSIDALIQSNDKYHATVYLNKFAKLLRNILDSSKQTTVTLAKDLETLQLYIDLEQLRYENKFTAAINADETLLQDDFKVPPLIVQPYVENAILHGLKNRTDNLGRLSIAVVRQAGHIEYVIEDNGVGREALRNRPPRHNNSYGMQMSSDRVRFFNNEENASVIVTDLENNGAATGTKVQVLLKIQ